MSKEIGQHMEGAINEPAHAADVHLVTPPERCPAFERLEYASGNKGPNFSLPIKHESIGRESGSSGQGRDNEDTIAPRNENDEQVTMHIAVVKAQLQKERASNIPQKNDVNFKGSDNKHAHEVPSSTLPATLENKSQEPAESSTLYNNLDGDEMAFNERVNGKEQITVTNTAEHAILQAASSSSREEQWCSGRF